MIDYSVVVPTYNGGKIWQDCLRQIRGQSKSPREVMVVDSSSTDGTPELAQSDNCKVITIPPIEFNHGETRSFAINRLEKVEVVLLLTQDAVFAGPEAMELLLKCFEDESVGAVYGKQHARDTATIFEMHERQFTYPSRSNILGYSDRGNYGMKTCFLSNAFTAYRMRALKDVGGFPNNTIVSEDMFVGAKLLQAGWKLAYCAEAAVVHSHSYNLGELFGRYFDIGVFNAREPWIRKDFGAAEGEGKKYVMSEMGFLFKKAPWLIPYALVRTLVKFLGFKAGLNEKYLPNSFKKAVSRQKNYWS